jgi:tRNA threonylcarbamoyl adenosine modification protein YeaZ
MRGRTSSRLTTWIQKLLTEFNINIQDINHWTVGSGPGSFTGMRMAAALVEGLAFNKHDLKTRCVPTALALASELDTESGEHIAVIFDGRNREILIYGAENQNGNIISAGIEKVLNAEQAPLFFSDNNFSHFTAFANDKQAIENIVPAEIVDKIDFVEHLPVANLIFSKNKDYDCNLTDLVYIRPAVHTQSSNK